MKTLISSIIGGTVGALIVCAINHSSQAKAEALIDFGVCEPTPIMAGHSMVEVLDCNKSWWYTKVRELTLMTFEELKTELERMSPEQLQQEVSAFVVRKGAQYNCPVALQFAEGDDALSEAGEPYFLVGWS